MVTVNMLIMNSWLQRSDFNSIPVVLKNIMNVLDKTNSVYKESKLFLPNTPL